MTATTRTLKITAPGLMLLLQAIGDNGIRAAGSDQLPSGCAIAGDPRWDAATQSLEIDVFFHHWENDTEEIELLWARLLGNGEYGPATTLDIAPAPSRR